MKDKDKNNRNPNDNINLKIFIYLVILVLLTFGCTYLFYNMFDTKDPSIVSRLVVDMSNSSNTIDDSDKRESKGHSFKIYNKSNMLATYKIIYSDNIRELSSISRRDIHYELLLNNSIIKTGTVDDFTNDILISRKINSRETNNYTLRVWIDEDVYAKGVRYTYNLKILPMED